MTDNPFPKLPHKDLVSAGPEAIKQAVLDGDELSYLKMKPCDNQLLFVSRQVGVTN